MFLNDRCRILPTLVAKGALGSYIPRWLLRQPRNNTCSTLYLNTHTPSSMKLPGRLTLQHHEGCQLQFAKRHIEADTCVGTCAYASFAGEGKLYETEAPGSPKRRL